MTNLSVTPIAGALGAEIAGVDLSRSLDTAAPWRRSVRRFWTTW